jgi:sulfite reductase (NADPH) hemoprotein beta-component
MICPSFAEDDVPDAIETIINLYLGVRRKGETFAACLDRLGIAPFKEALYGKG